MQRYGNFVSSQAVADEFLPRLDTALLEYGVRIHGDEAVAQYMENTIL